MPLDSLASSSSTLVFRPPSPVLCESIVPDKRFYRAPQARQTLYVKTMLPATMQVATAQDLDEWRVTRRVGTRSSSSEMQLQSAIRCLRVETVEALLRRRNRALPRFVHEEVFVYAVHLGIRRGVLFGWRTRQSPIGACCRAKPQGIGMQERLAKRQQILTAMARAGVEPTVSELWSILWTRHARWPWEEMPLSEDGRRNTSQQRAAAPRWPEGR